MTLINNILFPIGLLPIITWSEVLYENIDQLLPNKLHGPMHYKIGVTCEYNEHVFYTLL